MSLGLIGGRMDFCRDFNFSYRFWTLSYFFWPSVEKVSLGFLKLHSTCPLKHFEGKNFFRKTLVFSIILGHWAKQFPAFCRKVFVGAGKTASHMSSGTFAGRMIFCENFVFSYRFRTLSENVPTFFIEKLWTGLSNLHSTCPWKHLEQKYFLNIISIFFNHSRTLSKRTFGLLSESFRRGCHNCNLHVLRTNWRKNGFL